MTAPHVAARATAEALGSVTAQTAIREVAEGHAEADLGWLKFVQLAAAGGWKTPACAAFVRELTKRAAAAASVQ